MAYLLLILTPMFWAGNFISARAIAPETDPLLLALLRWILALLLILPWWLPVLRREWRAMLQNLPVLSWLSLWSVASFNTMIYLGVETTTASNAAIFQAIIPVLIMILSWIFYSERVSVLQWLGVALSISGVLVIVSRAEMARLLGLQLNPGDLWIMVAVASWAIYSVTLRHRPSEVSPFGFFGFSVAFGVIVLLPIAVWEQGGVVLPHWRAEVWSVVAYIAIFPSILAYLFWNRGVAEIGAPTAGLFIYLIPVFGLLLAILFLNETVHGYHLAGILLIAAGILLAMYRRISRYIRQSTAKEL
ncbi:MAG: DMT family transporter [Oceanospirillaceae bacterium]|nr:DMT family transporter [Oceanospirillaceae bacterium]